ncbi:Endonuclease/exonuclease/phosphatase [Pterulicium gracile]|uniref:Endonuclease/exonuclease/phosphatase n=1 Tax=Pterulicium gracile TaxID=1884261 RepID=A0A5C3QA46_9AGAR|nr:Endonuclease/exonuclease/phosphatase [Pterula gracilis]
MPHREQDTGLNLPNVPQSRRASRLAHTQEKLAHKKHTKAAMKVASLSVNGYGGTSLYSRENRWSKLNQLVRDHKIAIALLQEVHLTEERTAEIEEMYSERMKVFASPHPDNPTAMEGVAVILGKFLIKTEDASAKVLVPGRALLVKLTWNKNTSINLLNVYAPNVHGVGEENAQFWETLRAKLSEPENIDWQPDMVAGDFNMVEDPVDRLTIRSAPAATTNALDGLKLLLKVQDGWRETYPSEAQYTFSRNNGQSRLDRIYCSETIARTARKWTLESVGIDEVDHDMAWVQVALIDAPIMGNGRWAMPKSLIKNKLVKSHVIETEKLALVTAQETSVNRTNTHNPQTVLVRWIHQTREEARRVEKTLISPITKKV